LWTHQVKNYLISVAAGDYATITKLARTTMIIPIALAFALFVARRAKTNSNYSFLATFPWFILLFLLAAVGNSLGLFGATLPGLFSNAGRFLIIVALAGVGLGTNLRALIRTGPRPIFLGLAVWMLVAISSLGLQLLDGRL